MSEEKYFMDINEAEVKERAVLVGLDMNQLDDFDLYMDELRQLAKACNMEVVCVMVQNMEVPNKATLTISLLITFSIPNSSWSSVISL